MEQQITNRSYKIQIEKLDGGYISDVSGKRKIHKHESDITGAIDIETQLAELSEGEFILCVDIIPRQQFVDAVLNEEHATIYRTQTPKELSKETDKFLSLRDQAIKDGIIQKADEFDPIIHKDHSGPISVGLANCYTIDELMKFDWKNADFNIPLTYSEKSKITGLKDSMLHNLWPKIITHKYSWTTESVRIKMTILAKYYQQKLDKKAKIETLPPRNDKRIMEVVTEMELLAKSSMVKSSALQKKLDALKKLLIQD